jgi:DNA-binding response OmpR family regulator
MGFDDEGHTTILLVEDDPAVAEALGLALADAGYRVAHVPRGRDALARLLQWCPDLLLLDLGLPDIDGLEACRLARRHAPNLPIIILTARSDTGDLVAGLERGADDYIRKPFDLDVLLARIAAVLRASERRDGYHINPAQGMP